MGFVKSKTREYYIRLRRMAPVCARRYTTRSEFRSREADIFDLSNRTGMSLNIPHRQFICFLRRREIPFFEHNIFQTPIIPLNGVGYYHCSMCICITAACSLPSARYGPPPL